VKDLNLMMSGGKPKGKDNDDVWMLVKPQVDKRHNRGTLKVTWAKGHATEEDVANGRCTLIEQKRNKEADELAEKGRLLRGRSTYLARAAVLRTRMAMVAQTMLLKVWEERRELINNEALRKLALEEELDEVDNHEQEWLAAQEAAYHQDALQEQDVPGAPQEQEAGVGWKDAKRRVPLYTWEVTNGEFMSLLKKDPVKDQIEVGRKNFNYLNDKGIKVAWKPGFPLALWEPVAWWWCQLKWTARAGGRAEGTLAEHQVAWLELVVDFELTTGRACDRDCSSRSPWAARAKLLRVIVKALLAVRGDNWKDLPKAFGDGRKTMTLAPFGAGRLPGLQRRPAFVGGVATIKCIGSNAWAAARSSAIAGDKCVDLGKHTTNYTGFGGEVMFKAGAVQAVEELVKGPALRRRLVGKQPP
jgi:hypothetical protein